MFFFFFFFFSHHDQHSDLLKLLEEQLTAVERVWIGNIYSCWNKCVSHVYLSDREEIPYRQRSDKEYRNQRSKAEHNSKRTLLFTRSNQNKQ